MILLLLIFKKMGRLSLLGKERFIRLFTVLGIIFIASWNSEDFEIRGDAFVIISLLHKPKRGI